MGCKMPGPHDKIIATAAKAALVPLNFRQKGRSRLWFADHGWWLTVVEFQPSAWSKGSYLNVAAHWLWGEMGCVSFDFPFGGRVAEHEEYQSDLQFAPAAARLAESAAREAQRILQIVRSLEAASDVLLSEARTIHPGWTSYHAGVASGLVGRSTDAVEMFASILATPAPPASHLHSAAERMARIASEPLALQREVASLIARQREALKLPETTASRYSSIFPSSAS